MTAGGGISWDKVCNLSLNEYLMRRLMCSDETLRAVTVKRPGLTLPQHLNCHQHMNVQYTDYIRRLYTAQLKHKQKAKGLVSNLCQRIYCYVEKTENPLSGPGFSMQGIIKINTNNIKITKSSGPSEVLWAENNLGHPTPCRHLTD